MPFAWGLAACNAARVRRPVLALLVSTLCATPGFAGPTQSPNIADFLDALSGDLTPPDKWGSENIPLKRDPHELLGQHFVREKLPANADAVSFRALELFAAECRVKGGKIEPQEGPVKSAFASRVLRGVPLRSAAKEQWRAAVAVCSRDAETVLGGFVAIVHDTTGVARRGDIGSRLMMRLANIPTVTAIYAYRPSRIATRAELQRQASDIQQTAAIAQAASDARLKSFYQTMAVGTETNCCTVIQVRGPMAEVAIPVSRPSINGERTFWSKQDRLFTLGYAICTYGLSIESGRWNSGPAKGVD